MKLRLFPVSRIKCSSDIAPVVHESFSVWDFAPHSCKDLR